MAKIWRDTGGFDVLYVPKRYPKLEKWAGFGTVSEIRVPGGHVGWLVLQDDALEFLTFGGPSGDNTAPLVVQELSLLRAENVPSAVAFDYVLIDREHSEPELTDLEEFRKAWDSERES